MNIEDYRCMNEWELKKVAFDLACYTADFITEKTAKLMNDQWGEGHWSKEMADGVVSMTLRELYSADQAAQYPNQ